MSFLGYPDLNPTQKINIKEMTKNSEILNKIPYTILESEEPQRTLLYNIWCRCHTEKNNAFITTIGSTGSGKSYTNIYFGYMLDVDKDGNHLVEPDNIIFDPSKFVDAAYNPTHNGQFFMKDEIEMDANSRRSFSRLNQIIGDVMSTIRYKRGIIFFNLPSEQQLDVQVLRLRFGNIECDKVAADGTHSIFKWEYIESSKKRDESKYNPAIRRTKLFSFKPINKQGYGVVRSKVEYDFLKLYLPVHLSKFRFLLKDYDRRKDEYLKQKYDEFKEELRKITNTDNQEELLEKYLMTIDKQKELFLVRGKPSITKIQKEFKVPISKAKLIASEYKGHNFIAQEKKEHKKERSDFLDSLIKNKKSLLD